MRKRKKIGYGLRIRNRAGDWSPILGDDIYYGSLGQIYLRHGRTLWSYPEIHGQEVFEWQLGSRRFLRDMWQMRA